MPAKRPWGLLPLNKVLMCVFSLWTSTVASFVLSFAFFSRGLERGLPQRRTWLTSVGQIAGRSSVDTEVRVRQRTRRSGGRSIVPVSRQAPKPHPKVNSSLS